MGIWDRDYMRDDNTSWPAHREEIGGRIASQLTPSFIEWVKYQLSSSDGSPVTALLAVGFFLVTGGWMMSNHDPEMWLLHAERLIFIQQHFTLDPSDLSAGRYHVLLTYGFMYSSFWHSMFMLFGLTLFGVAVEEKIGSWRMLVFFFSSAIVCGLFHLAVADVRSVDWIACLARDLNASEDTIAQVTEHASWAREKLQASGEHFDTLQGPAGVVIALIVYALLGRGSLTVNRRWLWGFAVIFVTVDWFGFFHFDFYVAHASRFCGLIVGLTLAVASHTLGRVFRKSVPA